MSPTATNMPSDITTCVKYFPQKPGDIMHDVTGEGLTDVRMDSSDLEEVRKLVFARLRGYRARGYLFGSRATGNAGRTSDIDVAILPLEPIPPVVFSEIREALDESRVIRAVELVDLSHASEDFRRRVLLEGIRWRD